MNAGVSLLVRAKERWRAVQCQAESRCDTLLGRNQGLDPIQTMARNEASVGVLAHTAYTRMSRWSKAGILDTVFVSCGCSSCSRLGSRWSTSTAPAPGRNGRPEQGGLPSIGRSRGGLNTKTHLVAWGLKQVLDFCLSPGTADGGRAREPSERPGCRRPLPRRAYRIATRPSPRLGNGDEPHDGVDTVDAVITPPPPAVPSLHPGHPPYEGSDGDHGGTLDLSSSTRRRRPRGDPRTSEGDRRERDDFVDRHRTQAPQVRESGCHSEGRGGHEDPSAGARSAAAAACGIALDRRVRDHTGARATPVRSRSA